jgi:hypothetical protein
LDSKFESRAFRGCGKVGFLVIPNTQWRNPYCAEILCFRVRQGARNFIGAITMLGTTVEEHGFSRALRIPEQRGL